MRQINYGDINKILLHMLYLFDNYGKEQHAFKFLDEQFILCLTNHSINAILNKLYGILSYRSRKNIERIIERYSKGRNYDELKEVKENYFDQLQIWYHLTSKFLIIKDTIYINLQEYENWKKYFHTLDEDIFVINHIINFKHLYEKNQFDLELAKKILYPLKTFITPYDPGLKQYLEMGIGITHAHLSGCYPAPFYWVAVMNCRINEEDISFLDDSLKITRYNTNKISKNEINIAKRIRFILFKYLKKYKNYFENEKIENEVNTELSQLLENLSSDTTINQEIETCREEYIDYIHILDLAEIGNSNEKQNGNNSITCKSLYGERLLIFFILYLANAKKCGVYIAKAFWFYIQIKNTFLSNIQQQEGIAGFDFFEYTLRQITWKKAKQKREFFKEIGEFLQESRSVVKLELMIAPQDSNEEYDKIINSITDIKKIMEQKLLMSLKSQVGEIKIGIVIHFIKNDGDYLEIRENSDQNAYRIYHYSKRDEIKKYADCLYNYKVTIDASEKENNIPILGIDTANRELYCPPEIFGEVYRMLFEQNFYIESSRKFRGKTYHVGEDFEHIMTGMRRIYEAICYLDISAGDRLGHCFALGVDVEKWVYSNSTVEISKIDILDNAIFEWHILQLCGIDDFSRIGKLEHLMADLSFEIFGSPISPQILLNSWLNRGNITHKRDILFKDENSIPDWIKLQGEVMKVCGREGCHSVVSSIESLQDICNKYNIPCNNKHIILPEDEVDRILKEYLYDKHTIERFLKLTSVDMINEIKYLTRVQELLINIIKERNIVIESNPTSNWLIGGLDSFPDIPCIQWLLKNRQMPFSINIDDPSVFGNSIENEYYLVLSALLKGSEKIKGIEHDEALEILNKIRIIGIESSFLK